MVEETFWISLEISIPKLFEEFFRGLIHNSRRHPPIRKEFDLTADFSEFLLHTACFTE